MSDARSPRPRRAVISTSVAVVATAIGSALVWQGAEALSRSASARMVSPPVEGLLFMLFGSVLLGVASVTILWSPAGVIVAGILHLLLGPLTLFFPPRESPGFWLLRQLDRVSPALSYGGTTFVVLGIGVAIGAAMVAIGIASARRGPASSAIVALSVGGGVVAIAFWVALVLYGASFYRQVLVMGDASIAAAAVLFAIALGSGFVLLASGRSPAGAWLVGGALTVTGVFLVFAYGAVLRAAGSPAWFGFLTLYGVPGLLIPPGVAILGLALGVTLRNRQERRFTASVPAAWAGNPTPSPYAGAVYPPPPGYPYPNTGYPPSTDPGPPPPPTR